MKETLRIFKVSFEIHVEDTEETGPHAEKAMELIYARLDDLEALLVSDFKERDSELAIDDRNVSLAEIHNRK